MHFKVYNIVIKKKRGNTNDKIRFYRKSNNK